MSLDPQALAAAGRAVGSTDVARVAIETYVNDLKNRLRKSVDAMSGQLQFPGVEWSDYEGK